MRALCSICSDLYDGEASIAAIVNCGHTFHDGCLSQWLNQSMTCPQCRERVTKKGVIHRLYFDQADEADQVTSPSRLQNEVGSLKALLREKDRERVSLEQDKESLKEEVKKVKQEKAKIEKKHQEVRSANAVLQQELTACQQLQQEALEAKQEAIYLNKKLQALTSVQSVIQGLDCDVQEMIASQTDVQQLATWCSVLKKELAAKRSECKQVQEQAARFTKEATQLKRQLKECTKELQVAREGQQSSERELQRTEKDMAGLRRKLAALQGAIGSPSDTAAGFAHRLLNESPAPLLSMATPPPGPAPAKRPRLSRPESDDISTTPELFRKPVSQVGQGEDPKSHSTQYLKISKASSTGTGLAKKQSEKDTAPIPLGMNIFKKHTSTSSGIIRKGYNGLGGHDKFIQAPSRLSQPSIMRKPAKVSATRRNLGPAPALPSLENIMP